ncbi:MAG: hypothetical protein EOP04_17555 [Proteobacteria bacterium]|nr:MAG: hypothetical protein EOP04_17555 [Pseudomonadota bacterium]
MSSRITQWAAACLAISLLGACGSEAVAFGDTAEFICSGQGFCLTVDNGTLFYGAYRFGEDELRFQIAKGSVNILSPWIGGGRHCGRLLSDENHVFVNLASCREEWKDHFEPRSVYRRGVYENIARRLLQYIETMQPPNERQKEWEILKELIDAFLVSPVEL